MGSAQSRPAPTATRAPAPRLPVSVILTTYENPPALALALAGLARQTFRGFELVVADDGSGAATRRRVARFAAAAPFPVLHVWQPDQGFRKCKILNAAVERAAGEYLVFLDGDCIAPPDLVATHVALARPGTYLSGSKMLMSAGVSEALRPAHVEAGKLDRLGSWCSGTTRWHRAVFRRLPVFAGLLDWLETRRTVGWHGEHASTFARYVRDVAGFDERFGYGYEDKDFGRRLREAGIRGRSIRNRLPVWHVYHDRSYASLREIERGRSLYEDSAAQGLVITPYGMPAA